MALKITLFSPDSKCEDLTSFTIAHICNFKENKYGYIFYLDKELEKAVVELVRLKIPFQVNHTTLTFDDTKVYVRIDAVTK